MGCEQGTEFYNNVYDSEQRYSSDYKDLKCYPVFQIALSMLKDINEPKILEIGCGTGQFAKMLWDNNVKDYLGVDFSESAIRIARSLSPQKFEQADIRNYHISNENNTIILLEVLEHICDDLEVIKKIPVDKNVIISLPRFDDQGHIRIFKDRESVIDRYGQLIKFDEVIRYFHWIIAKGVKVGTHDS